MFRVSSGSVQFILVQHSLALRIYFYIYLQAFVRVAPDHLPTIHYQNVIVKEGDLSLKYDMLFFLVQLYCVCGVKISFGLIILVHYNCCILCNK